MFKNWIFNFIKQEDIESQYATLLLKHFIVLKAILSTQKQDLAQVCEKNSLMELQNVDSVQIQEG